MMKAFKCDRCKDFFEERPLSTVEVKKLDSLHSEFNFKAFSPYELCKKCTKDLFHFLEKYEKGKKS